MIINQHYRNRDNDEQKKNDKDKVINLNKDNLKLKMILHKPHVCVCNNKSLDTFQ